MAARHGKGVVEVEYHQAYLAGPGVVPDTDDVRSNGAIDPGVDGGATVRTGVASGGVRYTWAYHEAVPAPELDDWEDVAEVAVVSGDAGLHVTGWGGGSFDETDLAFDGPGTYAVRVSARGRDRQWDEAVGTAKERFHLDVWPLTDDFHARVLKGTSEAISELAD